MLEIIGLEKAYGGLKVLNGLNMSVEKGSIYGLLGRNGCGKTTTMNIICSIIKKDVGTIKIGTDNKVNDIKIGYLPESPSLYGYMNPVEYLQFIAACCNYKGDIDKRVNELIDMVNLSFAKRRRIRGFSRGMTQKMGIAASIFNEPDLLLLDEPTSALDPQGRAEVMSLIQKLKDMGNTIILSTHILSDVERVADKIGIMNNGKMVLEGSIKDIINQVYGESDAQSILHVRLLKPISDEDVLALKEEGYDSVKLSVNKMELSFTITDKEADIEKITKSLALRAIIPQNINVEGTSLEDIYFKYTNQNRKA